MNPRIASPHHWHDEPSPRLDGLRRAWLRQPGALTAGLRRLGRVELFVRRETVVPLPTSWADEAGLSAGTAVWWREILMTLDGLPGVQACSFTPWRASLGPWKAMRGLGRRPLADILYRDPRIVRSPFRFGRLLVAEAGGAWEAPGNDARIEARHSVFARQGEPLLVAEYFLPAFWMLAGRSGATEPRPRLPRYECGWPARPA